MSEVDDLTRWVDAEMAGRAAAPTGEGARVLLHPRGWVQLLLKPDASRWASITMTPGDALRAAALLVRFALKGVWRRRRWRRPTAPRTRDPR